MTSHKTETLHQKVFFSVPRHKLIATRAQKLLSDQTDVRVVQVLSAVQATSLSSIAGWADEIKHREANANDDQDTKDFKADVRNKNMGTWHYVDLPLSVTGYDRLKYPQFTRDDDVVQMTLESLRVLSGQSDRFSQANALRLLVHLVGDLHQPLHVACGYIKKVGSEFKIITDPTVIAAESLKDDTGGNDLLFSIDGKNVSLHSYWDSALELGGGHHTHSIELKEKYEEVLAKFVALPEPTNISKFTTFDWDHEIVKWANESLRAARTAYDQVVITGKNGPKKFDAQYQGSGSYETRCVPIVQERMRLASERLAQLLESVYGTTAGRFAVRASKFDPTFDADTVHLKYGGHDMIFRKSEDMIGIKPKSYAKTIKGRLAADPAVTPTGRLLGGFEMAKVAPTREGTNRTLDKVRLSDFVKKATHVYHSSADCQAPLVPTGELFVKFKEGTDTNQAQQLLATHNLKIVESLNDPLKLIVQVTSKSKNPVKAAADLQQSAIVAVAEPDFDTPVKLHAVLDPKVKDQWHLRNTGNHRGSSIGFKKGADARVLDAWEATGTNGSAAVVVALIDDGFDLTHPDLSRKERIVSPMNFANDSDDPSPRRTYGEFEDVDQVGEWHGTCCAGVAVGDLNGTGIAGAAPGCAIMPVKWSAGLTDREVRKWFDYVRESGAAVVSCSWGASAKNFPLSETKKDTISRCANEGRHGLGTVILFAAGNENREINDPGRSVNGFAIHPDVVAVAASTSMDDKADYSNYGKEIVVCAPSSGGSGEWGILTSDVTGTYKQEGEVSELAAGYAKGNFDEEFGGTSSATPLVAGICGLILSVNPMLTAQEVKEILKKTARKVEKMKGAKHTKDFGYGCVDAAAAVKIALEMKPLPAEAKNRVPAKP